MFTSRNIHFAILGIILGATTGYIFAFYQVESATPPTLPPSARSSSVPQGHPSLNPEDVRRKVDEELAKNPKNTEIMTLYANFLFNQGKFTEAVEWFEKALTVDPDNLNVHTDLATALWNSGQKDKALVQYQQILKRDPKNIPTLHNMVIVHLEERDFAAAEQVLKQIELIDPKYEGLEPLKKRLSELRH